MSPLNPHPILAISQGDPCGIGPEIIIKALAREPKLAAFCRVYGDPKTFESTARKLGLALPKSLIASGTSSQRGFTPGHPGPASGDQAYQAIIAATQAVQSGEADAIVTAPISKLALNQAGHHYPGHTELLAELAGKVPVRMMLANPELRVILVTVHMPLRQAIDAITSELIVSTLRIAHESLSRVLPAPPRLAVAGLNPHAGEAGMLGHEETEIISPAIEAACKAGINASGPYPPDTVFMQARGLQRFDAVIAMYHDQGLIPVKYPGVEEGVNITLGLPFTRTSPDHGTAFDIAGKGAADPASMLSALHMAVELSIRNHKKV